MLSNAGTEAWRRNIAHGSVAGTAAVLARGGRTPPVADPAQPALSPIMKARPNGTSGARLRGVDRDSALPFLNRVAGSCMQLPIATRFNYRRQVGEDRAVRHREDGAEQKELQNAKADGKSGSGDRGSGISRHGWWRGTRGSCARRGGNDAGISANSDDRRDLLQYGGAAK